MTINPKGGERTEKAGQKVEQGGTSGVSGFTVPWLVLLVASWDWV
jgi:hypothetical protein